MQCQYTVQENIMHILLLLLVMVTDVNTHLSPALHVIQGFKLI